MSDRIREVEIAIVGAGPAGLAAALEASESGAEIVVIDEYGSPGGQFYKQIPAEFSLTRPTQTGRRDADGVEMIRRLQATHAELMLDTLVWDILDARTLVLYRNEGVEFLRAKRFIIAPGAQEVPIGFPGWTLPGVMMGGAAQGLLATQHILPGRRVVLAGVGPLQLKVASQFLEAGAEVVEILEASEKSPISIANALRSWGHWSKMREGMGYWLKLQATRTPYRRRHVPVRVLGRAEMEAVVVARVDDDWRVVPGTERTLEADTLCLSYGFLPSLQLTSLLGCKLHYAERAGGWITWHDSNQQTSLEGVFVAGEAGGIGGAEVAEEEGRLAGIAAARSLGRLASGDRQRQEQRARKRLRSARRFAELVGDMLAIKPGLFGIITDDTVVCRCEEVTAGQVKAVLASGDPSVRGVKTRTRAGMGLCQGRMCGSLIRQLISKETRTPMDEIPPDTPRPPVKPVPIQALLCMPEGG
jgi:NADPH-dependent 2,4-dienoyl-CoA reductase/sulfur reductase-like enzyme